MKHTPGPWCVWKDGLTIAEEVRSESDNFFPFEIAKVSDDSNTDRANACLIAAAPELLAALLALKTANGADNFNGWHEDFLPAIQKANAAIAKATGQ